MPDSPWRTVLLTRVTALERQAEGLLADRRNASTRLEVSAVREALRAARTVIARDSSPATLADIEHVVDAASLLLESLVDVR